MRNLPSIRMPRLFQFLSIAQVPTILLFASLTPGICVCQDTLSSAKPNDSQASPDKQPLIITASELSTSLDTMQVVDTRTQDAYNEGHIAGSVWVDVNGWMTKSLSDLGLQDEAYWAKQIQSLGISGEQPVVVAGESITSSARVWWLLRYLGVEDVRLLDGGIAAWKETGLALSGEKVELTPSAFRISLQAERLAQLKDVVESISNENPCRIIDNRSDAEFTGERGVGTRKGHIAGAIHLEWKRFLNEDGTFKSRDELAKLLSEQDLTLDSEMVAHCQTGGRSSVAVFVLELAGASNVKNYYRGWSEYSEQLSAPYEK